MNDGNCVWIVMGGIDYEGAAPIAVFKTEAGAEKFARKVRQLIEDEPRFNGSIVDTSVRPKSYSQEWDAYNNDMRVWEAKMKALGVPPIYDNVEVLQMEVRDE